MSTVHPRTGDVVADDHQSCPHQTNLRALSGLDPYPSYRSASGEAPLHWDSSMGGWVVLGFNECSRILKDDETFVMPWGVLEGGDIALGKYGIFNLTGAAHAQAHKELLDFFNPRKNQHLQPTVRRLVTESFERVRGLASVDFIRDIARRVPGMVGLAFLGVPQDETVLDTVHEANAKLQNYMQSFGDDPVVLEELQTAHRELVELWGPTIEARRREPAHDLISRLVQQEKTLPDWSDGEIISQCLFFFGASFGNTANAIANAAYVLATDDQWQQALREHPDRVSVFVDEVLRVWAAVQFRIRIAVKDADIGGERIRAGERIILVVGAANRDDEQFPHPDQIDLTRTASRRHLTFGVGSRYCVGATLARIEAEEIVRALVAQDGAVTIADPTASLKFAGLNYRVWEPLNLQLAGEADSLVVTP